MLSTSVGGSAGISYPFSQFSGSMFRFGCFRVAYGSGSCFGSRVGSFVGIKLRSFARSIAKESECQHGVQLTLWDAGTASTGGPHPLLADKSYRIIDTINKLYQDHDAFSSPSATSAA